MAKAKKFGTFSGVFTPSILTILGVIMYLRFPAIIGQAGLINTIGIIVIAHIISITTSLSVASLSTDKPVQNGGTYFMISRSLGLPIGGTLGLALFVGLSFSVSLYLIGFSESFLQYWGFENTINSIRLTGTIVLVAVTTITFISTSLAIKSQYFIMVAIVLSLLSIFLGKHDFAPTTINFAPLATAAPFMLLFGIFFPAVTGFEAGVSMSGDLKDPRKSLPMGAIMAVGVGFVVYIALAFFYAYTVDSNALVNDPEILFKISLVPALVIIGIWGATLSSALGSILGAPRILQAIAMDKIAPKFLAKGTGKTNEPRNALLLAFVIAEAGILIGELDVIARIVSMFFITTYAFLNLASAIESWSSSDFRPAFKIPRFVSILGTLSAFIVMILLDFLALAGATVVLGVLYFYLRRKELILESGDAWNSFWTNLAKKALLQLSAEKDNKRNWRPNIILFSGGENARPHLVDMGISLTGKLGALTDFNLNTGSANENLPKRKKLEPKNKDLNYFTRELGCEDIQNGIKTVTTVYGFSGFEPNTVLMGWSRNTENATFLGSVLKDLKSKNLNTIFLDYNKESGFGKKQNIDIWWNGKGNHLEFTLNLLRFLLADTAWRDAKVRILVINSDTLIRDNIYRNTNSILSDKRIKAEVRVLSDDFGTRSRAEIISSESINADLIIMGLSQKTKAYSTEYIQYVNKITLFNASLLILSPSDEFESINLIETQVPLSKPTTEVITTQLPELPAIDNSVILAKIEKLDNDLLAIGHSFIDQTINNSCSKLLQLTQSIDDIINQNKTTLEKELLTYEKHEAQKTLKRNHQLYLAKINTLIDESNTQTIKNVAQTLNQGITDIQESLTNYIKDSAENITLSYLAESSKKEKNYKYPYQKALYFYLNSRFKPMLVETFRNFEQLSASQFESLRSLVMGINDIYEKQLSDKTLNENDRKQNFAQIQTSIDDSIFKIEQFTLNNEANLLGELRQLAIVIANNLETPAALQQSKKTIKLIKGNTTDQLTEFSESWETGMLLLNNALSLDSYVLSRKNVFKNVIQKGNDRIQALALEGFVKTSKWLIENIQNTAINTGKPMQTVSYGEPMPLLELYNETYRKGLEMLDEMAEEFDIPNAFYTDAELNPISDLIPVTINPKKTAAYYIGTLFHEPIYRKIEELENSINKAIIECNEANSMLHFHMDNIKTADSNNDTAVTFDNSALLNKLASQVQQDVARVEEELTKMQNYAMVYLHDAFSKLFYNSIVSTEKDIYTEKRSKKGLTLINIANKQFKTAQETIIKSIAYLLNSTSSGIILSKKYLAEKNETKPQIRHFIDLVEQLNPNKKTFNAIPVFYRNLMHSDSKVNDELWVERKTELNTIKEALKRHKSGIGGAVLIKGVHGSGKSTLSRYAAMHLFNKNRVFWINPPIAGSTNPDDLLVEFKKQLVSGNNLESIFENLPFGATVILNNLELWWERRPEGGAAIDKIIELIEKYGNKVFFILNCNTYAFDAMRTIYPIEDNCLAIINCEPFNSAQLQQLILSRHKSSSMQFSYNGNHEENISQLQYSILFNTYFNVSLGIPGNALNCWKANITDVKENLITIRKPKKPNNEILTGMQHDWLVVTAIFMHHKNMDSGKLSRITGWELNDCESLLVTLKNATLIVNKTDTVFTLEPYIEPLLNQVCNSKGLI